MTHEQAVDILKLSYPNAVAEKTWNPYRGKHWYRIISCSRSWVGGLDGGFTCIALSEDKPTVKLAVAEAANKLTEVQQ